MENRFHRDLRFLTGVGAATAGLIAAVGYFALRGLRWEESGDLGRELACYAAAGAGLLAIVGAWAWRVVRRLKRLPPAGG